jgi:polysaccharide export outer membrane protein
MMPALRTWSAALACCALLVTTVSGQSRVAKPAPAPAAAHAGAGAARAAEASADYIIGPSDVLNIVFWREKELSSEVLVRPDGKISMPLLNDVMAAGLTPEQLRRTLADAAKRYIEDPVVTVVVKQINNNRVFVMGQVRNPGPFVLTGPTTVLQALAMAGGFTDFADRGHVLVTRVENGAQSTFTFNYDTVVRKGDLSGNLLLKAGDTIVVP